MDKIKEKKQSLLSGTIVYFIGNVLTQFISLLLLKCITGNISTEAYGYFNLVVTIDNLITPILTLQISDAVFRFMIKSNTVEEKKQYYSSAVTVIILGAIAICVVILISSVFIDIPYPGLVTLYIISTNMFGFQQRVARAQGKNKQYVASNLMKTIVYILLQVLLVVSLKMGVAGLFLANIISTFACMGILSVGIKSYTLFDLQAIKKCVLKQMISFSAPLIPNTAVWWLQSSVNSIVISTVLGIGANGIYTVSNKFSAILNLAITVFSLAWQESAIKEYGTPEYVQLATESFNTYSVLLFSGAAALIPAMKILIPYLIDSSYYDAIQYAPFLLYSTALSAFSGFFASIITAKNQNKKLLSTNCLGAVCNITIVILFIKLIGIWSIVVSAVVSNIILAISRYKEVEDIIERKGVNVAGIVIPLLLGVINGVVYFTGSSLMNALMFVMTVIIAIIMNRKFISEFFDLLKTKIAKKG